MILAVHKQIAHHVSEAVRRQFGLTEVPPFAIEVPPSRALGDLSVTVAFQLARVRKKPPRVVAQELVGALGNLPGVLRVVAAANGYLNLYLDRRAFLVARVADRVVVPPADEPKTIVEHTAINPNKAAHIGHLRNAALGDTLSRVLRSRGTAVEIQNYIDDLGVQVADIVVGFQDLERMALAEVRGVADHTRFDHYCWDLYSRVTEWYDADRGRLSARERALHELETGGNPTAELGAFIVDLIVDAHLKTMARLNIAYDLLTYESDILRLQFWARAFELLKERGAVFLQTEGRLAGCWVMAIGDSQEQGSGIRDQGSGIRDQGSGVGDQGTGLEQAEETAREKVIVRSNGVVTYIGKDLANQFWKLGLLGLDFRYRRKGVQADGRPLWATTSDAGDGSAPAFGHAGRIYNVIDSRQMYLQALLAQALRTLGYATEAENSVHLSYEMVALSHRTARELGHEPVPGSVEARKPFVEVSGRKGLGVKVDDLLDLLADKAAGEVAVRNPELSDDERRRVGQQIAVAAIRYFMLKFSRGKLIVFDIEEALSFEGETGPYLQYAVVRANNIFNKLQERDGLTAADIIRTLEATPADELNEGDEPHDLWAVVFEASRLDEVVEQVTRSLEFSALAKYAFGLAQIFSAFYHRYPILNEERADRKRWRAAGVAYVRAQLTRALDLMGIEVPPRM